MEDKFPDQYTPIKWQLFLVGIALGIASYVVYCYDYQVKSYLAHTVWHCLIFSCISLCVYALPVKMKKTIRHVFKPAGDVPAVRDHFYWHCVYEVSYARL